VSCTVSLDQIGAGAAAEGIASSGAHGVFAGVADLLSPTIFTDSSALSQLEAGTSGRQLDAFLLAAYLTAPCAHSAILKDQAALDDVVSAVSGYLAPAPVGATISVTINGPSNNQTFDARLDNEPLPESIHGATERFGAPSHEQRTGYHGEECAVQWPSVHVSGTFTVAYGGTTDGCVQDAGTVVLEFGSGWRTDAGLAVGDPASNITRIYPDATESQGVWTLIRYFYGAGFYVIELSAHMTNGVVSELGVAGAPDE